MVGVYVQYARPHAVGLDGMTQMQGWGWPFFSQALSMPVSHVEGKDAESHIKCRRLTSSELFSFSLEH